MNARESSADNKEDRVKSVARTVLLAFAAALAVPAWAGDEAKLDAATVVTKEELVARHPEIAGADIHAAPIAGLYEVALGNRVFYVSTDGRYVIHGDVVDIDTEANLTEARRAASRAALFSAIDPAKEIVFPAKGDTKYRVVVFTDVDCGYCREFHRQIEEVNALGIEVRYVSYPRTGPNTESWTRAEHVWCAADRKAALTAAKLGGDVAAAPGCTQTPIAEEYELGQRIGLPGTPSIYSDSGVDLGGYLPPKDLLAQLKLAAAKR